MLTKTLLILLGLIAAAVPVAAALGWLLFQELPNGMASFGITITILAGIYIIWRERAASGSPSGAKGPRTPTASARK